MKIFHYKKHPNGRIEFSINLVAAKIALMWIAFVLLVGIAWRIS